MASFPWLSGTRTGPKNQVNNSNSGCKQSILCKPEILT